MKNRSEGEEKKLKYKQKSVLIIHLLPTTGTTLYIPNKNEIFFFLPRLISFHRGEGEEKKSLLK
jgi:hypothetical protein